MRVAVLGLWHLGSVTAACLASAGHEVVGLDFDGEAIERLNQGRAPLYEPGLDELLKEGISQGKLRFTTDIADALQEAEIVWVAYDTPVDANDRADIEFVKERIQRLFPFLRPETLVLISSQLPVGSTRDLEENYASSNVGGTVTFAYSPENLRLGKAISVFTAPDRVVVGVRGESDREKLGRLLKPFTERVEWMSVESAEMSKHALNAFFAASIAFINEIAVLCECSGADAKEVERALKSESRIGPGAYLSPGPSFAGGTLARDIMFLKQIGAKNSRATTLISAVQESNENHKGWVRHQLMSLLEDLRGARIAVWGLAYKPGTDTLRRSSSVELCAWLAEHGARVRAHDPAIKNLPVELSSVFSISLSPVEVLADATALVVATPWPEYQSVPPAAVIGAMADPLVIDPGRFLAASLGDNPRVRYVTIGRGIA